MVLHRVRSDVQAGGDVGGGQSVQDQLGDLAFPRGQAVGAHHHIGQLGLAGGLDDDRHTFGIGDERRAVQQQPAAVATGQPCLCRQVRVTRRCRSCCRRDRAHRARDRIRIGDAGQPPLRLRGGLDDPAHRVGEQNTGRVPRRRRGRWHGGRVAEHASAQAVGDEGGDGRDQLHVGGRERCSATPICHQRAPAVVAVAEHRAQFVADPERLQ
nr:hypothetical protein [Nocardia vaccinii]